MNNIFKNYLNNDRARRYMALLAVVLLVSVFYLLSLYNYLLYHSLVELMAIVVAITIFIVGWNTREFSQQDMMLLLAAGYLVVGITDLLHTLSFKGMGVFPDHDANLATQFWIAARYVEGVTVFLAAYYLGIKKKFNGEKLLAYFLLAGTLLTISIFTGIFPDCFVEGEGLTTFKVASEYIISFIFLASGIVFWLKKDYLGEKTLMLLLAAFGLTIMSEMSFTLYVDVYGFFNYLGHVFKFFSIVLVYHALVEESLKNPYNTLFRELAAKNKMLKQDINKRKEAEAQTVEYAREIERLYSQLNEEVDKARQVHEKTLPKTIPQAENISIAAYYQPAQKVGGDFYDVIKKDNKIILYVSDVMGHGLDSALMSVFVKNTIKNYVSLTPTDNITPESIMHHLTNQYILENYHDNYFVCTFLAVLDLEKQLMSYTSSGFQFSPMARASNGDRVYLVSEGLPISAAFPRELLDFKENTFELKAGTTIMITTDGLLERQIEGRMYQEQGEEVFFQNSHLPPNKIIQEINEDFRRFNKGALQADDDITFMVVQVKGEHVS